MPTEDDVLDDRHWAAGLKVALVHDWLLQFRGSERVLLELARIFPQAILFASVLDRSKLPEELASREIRTTFIDRLPNARKWYQKYLPLMPLAFEALDLSEFDLVISSSHACAKGVIPSPASVHLCYCYTPMRYAWSGRHDYLSTVRGRFARWVIQGLLHYLRMWDASSSLRVDRFMACSSEVKKRINRYYGRESVVVYPPVADPPHRPKPGRKSRAAQLIDTLGGEPFYLSLGRLVQYKRVDLAVKACSSLNRQLVVAGSGPELKNVREAAGSCVHFLEEISDEEAHELFEACSAFLFPGSEDFGLTVVEAQLHGKPVIAYAEGGVLDTVLPGETGILFADQSVDALIEAIQNHEIHTYDQGLIRRNAERFNTQAFGDQVLVWAKETLKEKGLVK